MYLHKVPASTGVLWFRRGIGLFSQNPLFFLALNCFYLLVTMATALIPIVNVVAPFFMLPFVSVFFMTASRTVYAKQPVSFRALIVLFHKNEGRVLMRRLIIFGVCHLGLNLLLFAASAVFDGGKLMQIVLLGQPFDAATLNQNTLPSGLLSALLFVVIVYAPLSLLFWFAPVLSAWSQVPPHKALFFAWMACWRNLGAFVMLAMLWIGAAFLVSFALTGLLHMLGVASNALVSTWFLISVILISMFWCSLYMSYASCFEAAKTGSV